MIVNPPVSICRLICIGACLVIAGQSTAWGAMELLHREMFSSPGTLTAASPGANFAQVEGNLLALPGGPRLLNGPAASADIRNSNGHAIGRFVFPNTHRKIFACGWFLVKEVAGLRTDLIAICNVNGGLSPSVSIVDGKLGAAISWQPYVNFVPSNKEWVNRWIFIGVAVHLRPDSNADVRFYCKAPGEAMQSWAAINHSLIGMTDMGQVIAGSWAFGPQVKCRVGAPAVYTFTEDDFSDVVYPSDLIEPVIGRTWYCDPQTGNDLADGATPQTAWKTAAKINEESLETGMLPATGHATGDTLIINTGGQALDLNGVALNLRTPGLNVRAASDQEWIRIKSYRSLPSSSWQTTGAPNVYSCADTETSTVLWEDDKFMNHPVGTSFSAVQAQLSSVPGSFWTDGVLLYVHPFNSTDPRTDGKRYDRSYRFTEGAAVVMNARDINLQDIHAGKTCLADWVNNDPLGNYCLGGSMPPGQAVIKHCYLYYGAKHILGITVGDVADHVLIEDVQAEQASPYPPAGYQTVWVSYNHQSADLGITHRYHRCRTVANAGLIGSTEGVMSQAYPVFYAHNMGGGQPPQFKRFEFFDCDFGIGNIQGEAVEFVKMERTRCGSVWMAADIEADRCFFQGMNVGVPGWSFTERNCIHVIEGELRKNSAGGTLDIQGCTFDARQITGIQGGVPQASLFTREQPLHLVFQNNLVLMPAAAVGANVFSNLRSTDSLQMSHNAYSLGGNTLVYQYHDGTSAQNRSLSQWQALGFDSGSFQSASMTLNGLEPAPGSPLINAGLNLATLTDYSGASFRKRNDIGAYEAHPTSYELWQAENFTPDQMANPTVVGASASYLRDGVPNLVKYALGLHPDELSSAAAPLLSLDKTVPAAPVMNVFYQRSRWAGDLSLELQFSEDLVQWVAVPTGAQQVIATGAAAQQMQAVITPPSGVRGFVRLKLLQP